MEPSQEYRWIESIKLSRFKAAFEPDEIPLRPFSVIIGRNGSGKSTMLEALLWLDTTMRQDARTASEPYHGVHDLFNLRTKSSPYFDIELKWSRAAGDPGVDSHCWYYGVRVREEEDEVTPRIAWEELSLYRPYEKQVRKWITTEKSGQRIVHPQDGALRAPFDEPDRLALSRGFRSAAKGDQGADPFVFLKDFWQRMVFLRLSPARLVSGSLPRRRSFDPLLDPDGQMLPALLGELDDEQRARLIESIQNVLSDMRGVEILGRTRSRDEHINYALNERMPYVGRGGKRLFSIPAWMLSEGTRRLTAIFALLEHDPPPTLLCIEEIENGLDPWTVRYVIDQLQSAVDRGTQVLVTTHSPWLLDYVPIDTILQVRRTVGETIYEAFESRKEVRAYASSVPAGTRYVNEAE